MADDPNRDILPVKDGSCVDTYRSSIDPRERHFVCKLDRYQLEDKYLRLLEEASNLKKLSNCQEDKIKRLATKLMRVSVNPRARAFALDVCEDKDRITVLELENSKLKDKINVLRNQLLNHTIAGRSSSRSRNPHVRPSSGLITCRSENSRMKAPSYQNVMQAGNGDDNEIQNYLIKIEELENQRKDMLSRIAQLEKELAGYAVGNQREKVAENVEYIRVWRQMKQLNDKLIAAQDTNESLNVEINELKRTLEETTKNNQEITVALVAEKKRIAEIDEQMLKAKDSQLTLREKDEQIRDLLSEMKILQQHNNELIALSTKYGQVELENAELKKKVSEQLYDQQTLKTAFSTEQANIAALQAANEQLLAKLQELQKNIDTLTVQLMSFQSQNERRESPARSPDEDRKKTPNVVVRQEVYKDSASQVEQCKKCCETYEKILRLEKVIGAARDGQKLMNQFVQTEDLPQVNQLPSVCTKEQSTSPIRQAKVCESPKRQPVVERPRVQNTLSREKMLQLLEQAQINSPMDAARINQKDVTGDYGNVLDIEQRHRIFGNLTCPFCVGGGRDSHLKALGIIDRTSASVF